MPAWRGSMFCDNSREPLSRSISRLTDAGSLG
jgi:hypothetical protein